MALGLLSCDPCVVDSGMGVAINSRIACLRDETAPEREPRALASARVFEKHSSAAAVMLTLFYKSAEANSISTAWVNSLGTEKRI